MTVQSLDAAFGALVLFKKANGHCNVPQGYKTDDGFRLGGWVYKQRTAYWRGKLSPERIEGLESLVFDWDPDRERWDAGFGALVLFKKANGHCNVPQRYKTDDGFKLGGWASNQRTHYSSGSLSPERIERLENLDFVWNSVLADWEKRFAQLVLFKKANGHCNIPHDYKTDDGFNLGGWLINRRANYRDGLLHADRVTLLEELGVTWNTKKAAWEEGFGQLVLFKEANGHCNVPDKYKTEGGFRLGQWVGVQRSTYRQSKLYPERIERLVRLGFVWKLK